MRFGATPSGVCKVFHFFYSGSADGCETRCVFSTPRTASLIWRLRRVLRRRKIAILGEWDCPGQVKAGYWMVRVYRGRPGEADLAAAVPVAQTNA